MKLHHAAFSFDFHLKCIFAPVPDFSEQVTGEICCRENVNLLGQHQFLKLHKHALNSLATYLKRENNCGSLQDLRILLNFVCI